MEKKKRKTAPEGMYSAAEAIKVIGIPSTGFYGLVNVGELTRIVPVGRKEGYYAKSEIDAYARKFKASRIFHANEKLDFVPAFNEDLPAIHDLVASVSGGEKHAVPVDILKGWIRKNPQSVHILRRYDKDQQTSEILGYVAIFPLKADTLMQRLSGQLLNREIPFDDILTFRPGATIPIYIAEMAVKHRPEVLLNNEPDPSKTRQMNLERKLGRKIITETFAFISGLEKQGINIDGYYAVGTSPLGIRLCKEIGMQPMKLATGVTESRVPFSLDLKQEPTSPIVRRLLATV